MLIGIDASRALRTTVTGTERYSREIINHLLQLPAAGAHRWRLYTDHDPGPGVFPALDAQSLANVEVRTLAARRMWSHTALGPEVMRRRMAYRFVCP